MPCRTSQDLSHALFVCVRVRKSPSYSKRRRRITLPFPRAPNRAASICFTTSIRALVFSSFASSEFDRQLRQAIPTALMPPR